MPSVGEIVYSLAPGSPYSAIEVVLSTIDLALKGSKTLKHVDKLVRKFSANHEKQQSNK